MRIQRDPDNPLPDNKLFLEDDAKKKLQQMQSVETSKRLSDDQEAIRKGIPG